MKTKTNITKAALAACFLSVFAFFTACQKDANPSMNNPSQNAGQSQVRFSNPNLVFPPMAHMSGKTYGEWGAEWWKWTVSFDCATSPHVAATGSLQDQNQSGSVYFLAGAPFNMPAHRSAHVTSDQSLFFSLLARIEDDTTGIAGTGMSVTDYLTSSAIGAVDGVDILSATLDGVTITNPTDFRAHSGLFSYTGNPAGCVIGVTGLPTDAVTDGYWLMLKPLPVGTHILHFTGGISGPGLIKDVTDTIYVN